jgi:DHA2 family multidrug resistance protein
MPAAPNRNEEVPPLHGAQLVLMTIAMGLATFMEILDMTIVNVSIPSISGSLGVSPSQGTWTISSYSLAAAIMQPLTGWLGRRFGEVRTFVTCISLFVLFSAFCGLASSMPMLVFGRLMQGAVSGPLVPMAQALLIRNYPPERRGMAMGLWVMIVFIAPILGPIVGGWITDNLSWPWLFYINVPVGTLAALSIWTLLHKRDSKRVRVPIDAVGLALLVVGVGALQFMLDNGNEKDWFNSNLIVAAALVAGMCIAYLIAWELTDRHPVVDLSLFRERNFRTGVIAICVGYFCFFGNTVIFPLWLQTTMGYTAVWAGLATAPVGLLGLVLMPFIGKNIDRINLRLVSCFAFLWMGVTMYWLGRMNQNATFWQLVAPRFWQGLGVAFFFLPLNTVLLSGIAPDQIASAAGLSNFLRTIGGSMSTAISVWLWSHRSDFHYAILSEHIQGVNWSAYSAQLHAQGIAGVGAFEHAGNLIMLQARTLAANDVYRIFAVVLWLLSPVVWLAKPPFRAMGGGGH